MNNRLVFRIDPNKKFPPASTQSLADACGVIPKWFLGASSEELKSLKAVILNNYESLADLSQAAVISEDGTWRDIDGSEAPLDPVFLVETPTEQFYLYRYALIAIRNKQSGEVFLSRCD